MDGASWTPANAPRKSSCLAAESMRTFDGATLGRSADGMLPQMTYGRCMRAPSEDAVRTGSTRIYCRTCDHSEFVHGDRNDRTCLYSECGCSGFVALPT